MTDLSDLSTKFLYCYFCVLIKKWNNSFLRMLRKFTYTLKAHVLGTLSLVFPDQVSSILSFVVHIHTDFLRATTTSTLPKSHVCRKIFSFFVFMPVNHFQFVTAVSNLQTLVQNVATLMLFLETLECRNHAQDLLITFYSGKKNVLTKPILSNKRSIFMTQWIL